MVHLKYVLSNQYVIGRDGLKARCRVSHNSLCLRPGIPSGEGCCDMACD
jgi:hypothetical protein